MKNHEKDSALVEELSQLTNEELRSKLIKQQAVIEDLRKERIANKDEIFKLKINQESQRGEIGILSSCLEGLKVENNLLKKGKKPELSGSSYLIEENKKLARMVLELSELLKYAHRRNYQRKSEKLIPVGDPFVDGLFRYLSADEKKKFQAKNGGEKPLKKVKVKGYERNARRGKRGQLPEHLAKQLEHYQLNMRICPADGAPLKNLPNGRYQKLAMKPIEVFIREISYDRAICPLCNHSYNNKPNEILEKGILDSTVLAMIIFNKYRVQMPLYRQVLFFKSFGIECISKSTLIKSVLKLGKILIPIYNLLYEMLLSRNYLNLDETTLQVLDNNKKNSYLWGALTVEEDPIVLFFYNISRAGSVIADLLNDYKGEAFQADEYSGYNSLTKMKDKQILRIACAAHMRRKFIELQAYKKSELAEKALKYFRVLYLIEDRINNHRTKGEEYKIIKLKTNRSLPIMVSFKKWLQQEILTIVPATPAHKAIMYNLNSIDNLMNYCKNSIYRLDNNAIERAIRPITIGRKNWLFSASSKGAEVSALLLGIVGTASLNGINLWEYFSTLFKELPNAQTEDDFLRLLPLKSYFKAKILPPSDIAVA